ncbi:MAG: nitroreductase/quinone reductase family protein [Candidatus Nanopelagicales bacterium]
MKYRDGETLVSMAMNGWADPEPAWWLDLQARLECQVDTGDGLRPMIAHAAEGAERARLWDCWRHIDQGLDQLAARRSRPTAVVVFAPLA